MRRVVTMVLATLLLGGSAQAQKKQPQPKRPRLSVGSDTNSWSAYHYHGLQRLTDAPDEAADAFYWASQLDPSQAYPYYGRALAQLGSNSEWVLKYFLGVSYVVESKEGQRVDSLMYQARLRNPFLQRTLEKRIFEDVYFKVTHETFLIRGHGDPFMEGWLAYLKGQGALAATKFREALKRDPKRTEARLYLAESFYLSSEYDSAASHLHAVVEEMHKREQKKLVYFYQSKASFEYQIGMVHEAKGDLVAAREDYGRALTEDLAFYMAHARLGAVALAQGDTAMAMSEFDQAVQLKADDAMLHFGYGVALLQSKHLADAEREFRRTVELAPYYAGAYLDLAITLDFEGKLKESIEPYQAFVAHAPRSMAEQIAVAKQRADDYAVLTSKPPTP